MLADAKTLSSSEVLRNCFLPDIPLRDPELPSDGLKVVEPSVVLLLFLGLPDGRHPRFAPLEARNFLVRPVFDGSVSSPYLLSFDCLIGFNRLIIPGRVSSQPDDVTEAQGTFRFGRNLLMYISVLIHGNIGGAPTERLLLSSLPFGCSPYRFVVLLLSTSLFV